MVAKQIKRLGLATFFGRSIPDRRDQRYVEYSNDQLLKLRLMLLCCGYEDCNDVQHLRHDPALQALCGGQLPGQSTLSRWENSLTIGDVARLAEQMIDYYVSTIDPSRKELIIDVDCTDDPAHGKQQGSLFHGYHWQWMYNELFYLDGQTGQVILPILRPGNVHSSRWNERFLRLIVQKIRERFAHMAIHLRADAGFSGPAFYEVAEELDFGFCVGISANGRLKELIAEQVDELNSSYVERGLTHQRFVGPLKYQADSWQHPQNVYAKIESTGKGLNVRFYVSNYQDEDPEELYREYYVQRGQAAENRIKEIKNFCFSDRLSCHHFSANFFRLILSCLAYEVLRSLRDRLPTVTRDERLWVWSIHSIRLYLLKVAGQVKVTLRRVYFRLARGHPYQTIITGLLAG